MPIGETEVNTFAEVLRQAGRIKVLRWVLELIEDEQWSHKIYEGGDGYCCNIHKLRAKIEAEIAKETSNV